MNFVLFANRTKEYFNKNSHTLFLPITYKNLDVNGLKVYFLLKIKLRVEWVIKTIIHIYIEQPLTGKIRLGYRFLTNCRLKFFGKKFWAMNYIVLIHVAGMNFYRIMYDSAEWKANILLDRMHSINFKRPYFKII